MFHELNINEIYFNYEQKLGALRNRYLYKIVVNDICIFKKYIQLVFVYFTQVNIFTEL